MKSCLLREIILVEDGSIAHTLTYNWTAFETSGVVLFWPVNCYKSLIWSHLGYIDGTD